MSHKAKDWLYSMEGVLHQMNACADGLIEAFERVELPDDVYYQQTNGDIVFTWGISMRQPELAIKSLSNIALVQMDTRGLDETIRRALVVAGDPTATLGDLKESFSFVSRLKHGPASNRCVDGIAYRLLRWRLGHGKPVKTAEKVRGLILKHMEMAGRDFSYMDAMRAQVPFDLWEQGFQE